MGSRIEADAVDVICAEPNGFVLRVAGAADVATAATALATVRLDLLALGADGTGGTGGTVISNPVLGPDGLLVRVGLLDVDEAVLEQVPDLVARRLDEAGVTGAVVGAAPTGGRLGALDGAANAVVLRLFPPPGEAGRLPPSWIDVACEWALGDLDPTARVAVRLLGVEYELHASEAPTVAHQAATARAWCDVVNGRLDERLRTASITFGRAPHVALAAGGPRCGHQGLVARSDLLAELADELADEAGAARIDVEPTFARIGLGPALAPVPEPEGAVAPASQGPQPEAPAATSTVMPDLGDVVLEAHPHSRRGVRLTFLELAAWLAQEAHSDDPPGVSPVVATFARWFAAGLDDATRQRLKPLAARVLGTGPTGGRSPGGWVDEAELARAWTVTEWMVRVQAGSWLRLAGMPDEAAELESLGSLRDRHELRRAIDQLGRVTTATTRRNELTASITGAERPDDTDLVVQAAWDAWDSIAEASGWVAASEAAEVGVPPDLSDRTEGWVIERTHHATVGDGLEAPEVSLGDATWSTAVQAAAHLAWTEGWRQAHRVVDAEAELRLRVALDRAGGAAGNQLGLDDDQCDDAWEAAEAAARDTLAQAVLAPARRGEHPWDAARRSAAAADRSGAWARTQDLARAAVDDGPWEAGMSAARTAVDTVLRHAPDAVSRAVVAALAREAAGVAARAVALRAAAVARSRGASPSDTVAAATDAARPTAAMLQASAFDVLHRLVAASA